MNKVKIIGTPSGEAPLWVRESWIGLVLPLKAKFDPKAFKLPTFGVLSGPKTGIGQIFRFLIGRHAGRRSYYAVDPVGAIEILKEKSPDAARWWFDNAPHVISPSRSFGFEVEVCELEPDNAPNTLPIDNPNAKSDISFFISLVAGGFAFSIGTSLYRGLIAGFVAFVVCVVLSGFFVLLLRYLRKMQ